MRKEASMEQWKELYEIATKLKEDKPWEEFWDMDLIGVRRGSEEDTVFYSILGRGGGCYGIVVYEGYEGLNKFLMLTMQETMNLSVEYAMFSQQNLTCYWGNREELSEKQRKIIKELGYKYRGKNQWLYFMSYKPGYFPYNLDQDEVLRMTAHLKDLEAALQCYEKIDSPVQFENGEMFLLKINEDKNIFSFGAEPLPFTSFQFGNLVITDEELISELKEVSGADFILEADVSILGGSVNDKKYDRPANPSMCMIAEARSGMILKCEMTEPEEDAVVVLVETLVGFILQFGAPKEIRVSNVIVEAGLEHLCEICGTKLRRLKRLSNLDEFIEGFRRFGR